MQQTKTCPSPKTRSKILPWQTSLVTAPLMEAKTKMVNQTQCSSPTQKPQAQPTEGQEQQQEPLDLNVIQGDVPPKIIKRLKCKHLLKRLGLSIEAAQTIVHNHCYDTAKMLSCLKPDDVDILMKYLCASGRESADGTRDPGTSVLHSASCALISACFILFHQVHYNLCLMINVIN